MRSNGNKIFAFGLCAIALALVLNISACTGTPSGAPLGFVHTEKWVADSSGCKGDRESILKSIGDSTDDWMGASESEVLEALGPPNAVKDMIIGRTYFYDVVCKDSAESKSQDSIKVKQAFNFLSTQLLVGLDHEGRVNSIGRPGLGQLR